ncbi:hypothetical protein MKZ38_006375 [Zalerion maritima]|uniref:DUF3074 domain-containing protein n=1 Tax=Zalerion maritima TaxID=339359 RepID=A0AAD5WWC0_9PEZI|nr:hypothetical protein MKZ38_006375 [Zalerion maritima]
MASAQLGPLLRLRGLPSSSLPLSTAAPDELAPFIISLLSEALPFVDSVEPKVPEVVNAMVETPQNPWKLKATKKYPESDASVEIMDRTIYLAELERIQRRFSASAATGSWGGSQEGVDAGEGNGYHYSDQTDSKLKNELWCCRRSVHRDSAEKGTANWAEFRTAFRDHHAETELASTAEVVAIREAINYDHASELRVTVEGEGDWKVVAMKVLESRHHIPAPLGDRCFVGLQVVVQGLIPEAGNYSGYPTGEEQESKEFVVMHISLRDFTTHDKAELAKSKGVVKASFTSVERVRKMEGMGDIEWIMALSSDAKGVLPAWVQAKAVPGQIAKDVPLFLGWIARERETPGSGKGNFVGEKGEKRRDREREEREKTKVREERKSVLLEQKEQRRQHRASAMAVSSGSGVGGKARELVKRKSMDFMRMRRRSSMVDMRGQEGFSRWEDHDTVPVPPLPSGFATEAASGRPSSSMAPNGARNGGGNRGEGGKREGNPIVAAAA